jgi:Zn-dependent protease/predicted transcriptional regulator
MAEGQGTKIGSEAAPAEAPKITGGFHLFTVAGIKITIDYSWLIIFLLIIWSLSAGYFPMYFKGYETLTYWLAGFVATILFFASILIHELSHSLTALRCGLKIPEITLFLFGGVAHLSEEPSNPREELKIAIAGPIASFVLAGVFWLIQQGLHGNAPSLVVAIFDYLAWINLALAVFNLVPGYPLDGGRILRAILWWKTGSIAGATKWASDIGKGFAWALIILGVIRIFSGGLVGGLWLILIGMFLRGIAKAGYQDIVMKQSFEGVTVKEVMIEDIVSVPPEVTLDEATHEYFLKFGHGGFPVVKDGRTIGLISLAGVKDVSPEARKTTTVEQAMMPLSDKVMVGPEEGLGDALKKMTLSGLGRLLVMRGDTMVGMITKTGLIRFLEIKRVLDT